MIDLDKRFSPNWWDYSFCIEVDFAWKTILADMAQSAWYYEQPFRAEWFDAVIEKFREEFRFVNKAAFLEYVQKFGKMRVRPGPLWCVRPATNYKGDVYDLPIVWDPFTKFPFGPMLEKR